MIILKYSSEFLNNNIKIKNFFFEINSIKSIDYKIN